jgi:hypothetical protein
MWSTPNLMEPTIWRLEQGWECEWLELDPSLYEFLKPEQVQQLSTWTFDRRRLVGWAAYLYCDFHFAPAAEMHYHLGIDAAPCPARIYLNQRYLCDYVTPHDDAPPFDLDVTALLHNGRNQLAFRVEAESQGQFEGVAIYALTTSRS